MANTLGLQEWLTVIKDEYLADLVKDGGSSVKFVATLGGEKRDDVASALSDMASGMEYIVASIDASETRVHRAEDIFFEVASQIPWKSLIKQALLKLARESNYSTVGISSDSEGPILHSIAAANAPTRGSLSEDFILKELRPQMEKAVTTNLSLAKDFRVAMTHLCLAECRGIDEDAGQSPIIDWLTGTNRRVANIRPYSIYNTITRTNARHLFESLLHWIRFVEYNGLVLLIDDSRITMHPNPRDGLHYYTRPAVMDHYELLREFIDGTDRLEGLLMVILTNEGFLDEGIGRSNRGMGIYQALRGRVADEVRSRTQANPMSALVRLSHTAD